VHEELTLPKAPQTWGDSEPVLQRLFSAGGRTATTELAFEARSGAITQGWGVVPGGPRGA
jgi:hypothetical protein